MTSDAWILKTVQGLTVDFVNTPHQSNPRITPSFGPEKDEIIQLEVDALLLKGAIHEVEPVVGQFISTIFLVDKKSGGKRPVINLKYLNQFVEKNHFKMSGLRSILDQIVFGDLMFTMDLSDAYFSISIDEQFRKYFRFIWKGKIYEFLVMPFGLSSAPYIFTKLTKPIMAYLHARGLRSNIYIDDGIGLIKNNVDNNDALVQRDLMINIFRDLGFTINVLKSSLELSHRKVYLGFLIDSLAMKVFLTQEKLDMVVTCIKSLMHKEIVCIKDLARVIGIIISIFPAVYPGRLHYRTLEKFKTQQLYLTGSYRAVITLPPAVIQELQWWLDNIQVQNGKDIHPPNIDHHIQTDASLQGWGAVMNTQTVSGQWDQHQSCMHINVLEMLAVKLALHHIAGHLCNVHIQLQVDNTTVVSYLNRMGGTHSELLNSLAQDIWVWAMNRKIHLSAVHIAGNKNIQADYLSRLHQDHAGWMLNPQIFQQVCTVFYRPQIDLFANQLNHQLPAYVSWKADPLAWKINAYHLVWTQLNAYAFPPFTQINRVLLKIQRDQAQVLLITPNWPTQPWWPLVLSMSAADPILVTPRKNLLVLPPQNQRHPLESSLALVAWIVSGDPTTSIKYQQGLQRSSLHHGDQAPQSNTRQLGLNGIAGVIQGRVIPFHLL